MVLFGVVDELSHQKISPNASAWEGAPAGGNDPALKGYAVPASPAGPVLPPIEPALPVPDAVPADPPAENVTVPVPDPSFIPGDPGTPADPLSAAVVPEAPAFGGGSGTFPYVTLVYPEPDVTYRNFLQTDIVRDTDDLYTTVFSIRDGNATEVMPEVQIDVYNPPMIIDYDVSAFNISDLKHIEYRKATADMIEEDLLIVRPYEQAWFTVQVINRDTGEILDESGYGREFGLTCPGPMRVENAGRYSIRIKGFFVHINSLAVRIKEAGNIPPPV